MPRLDILLPFALPPAELAPDLRKHLDIPALAALATRAGKRASHTSDAFARALPHERWAAARFGLQVDDASSPPLAAALMRRHGIDADAGLWFVLHPVHLHIARDHLVLTDPRSLELPEQESRTLFDVARPLFDEYGNTLLYGDAGTWFMRADAWRELSTATPDAAAGHNVDLWMPHGEGERAWRKLQNEVQMHWFMHPLNAEREARGVRTVNSLWLWGAAEGSNVATPGHTATFSAGADSGAYLPVSAAVAATVADLAGDTSDDALLTLDSLLAPAMASDWGRWLDEMHALERDWFAPLLEQLRAGRYDAINLIATSERQLLQLSTTRASLRKFWRKPSLDFLFS